MVDPAVASSKGNTSDLHVDRVYLTFRCWRFVNLLADKIIDWLCEIGVKYSSHGHDVGWSYLIVRSDDHFYTSVHHHHINQTTVHMGVEGGLLSEAPEAFVKSLIGAVSVYIHFLTISL